MSESTHREHLGDPALHDEVLAHDAHHEEHALAERVGRMGRGVIEAAESQRPSRAELEARIDAFDEETEAIFDAIAELRNSVTSEEKNKIDRFEDVYGQELVDAHRYGREPIAIADFYEWHKVPAAYQVKFLAHNVISAKIEAIEQELEAYAPELAAEVLDAARSLELRIDYDKIATRYHARSYQHRTDSWKSFRNMNEVAGVRQVLESEYASGYDYQKLASASRHLDGLAAELEEQGFLEPAAEAVAAPMTVSREQLDAVGAAIQAATDMHDKYGHPQRGGRRLSRSITELVDSLRQHYDEVAPTDLKDVYDGSKVRVSDHFIAAEQRRLLKLMQEVPTDDFETDTASATYKALVEKARRLDIEQVLDNLEIGGSFEDLPFKFDEQKLKKFLADSVPPIALATLKRITFRPLTAEEDKEDNTLGLHTYSEELGGMEIIISDAKVYQSYDRMVEQFGGRLQGRRLARKVAESDMLGTITHEFGHELHEQLPVAALKRWEDQRASDPIMVTAYVKSGFDKNHPHRYMEDFADSMELFVNRPDVLETVSPARYQALQQIFEDFMPQYAATLKRKQDAVITADRDARRKVGVSDEQARAAWLSLVEG